MILFSSLVSAVAVIPLFLGLLGSNVARVDALQLDVGSTDSIRAAAKTAAFNMMTYYTGNKTGDTPGMLPDPYYWWEAGAMWMTLIGYWHYTKDSTYNKVITDALQFQVGDKKDFMPQNQTRSEGNDDQVFWAYAAMDATEMKFPDPPADKPQWLALAQAVFNQQTTRWDAATCGGGLRWQILPVNTGFTYKNTISNGGFFQLAARLARYTGNATYAEWADKMYDWMVQSPLVDPDGNGIHVKDGTWIDNNCTTSEPTQWTYNYGTMLAGSAYMYNYTNGSAVWLNRIGLLLNTTEQFFVKGSDGNSRVLSEISCETIQSCDKDQPSFKAYLTRWLAVTSQLVPPYHDAIITKLKASAAGAASQCSGPSVGTNGGQTVEGTTCGRRWYESTFDGKYGVGEFMSALSVFGSLLIDQAAPPVSAITGGTSVGDPNAGETGTKGVNPEDLTPIGTSGKAGAGILTVIILGATVALTYWVVV